ncbi:MULTISPECIES: LacI family DNA-binding transcriptional regulator [unclassified Pseudactinotalea]|uniref:LacI family DNA-binding transcriptional regulator n=1 Tax=unclassified Pseudactinotalea TaxID=2649176 RepID=UPI00128D6FD5|nr:MULTISPECIES: LacI family DNA-binding transcriptional regulator [unclassified Pseudactinotalea]MPV50967.1 LacI family DNA-binding transcriptional regulator [Pseudactinotalea sp. HY160]QGH70446.1 LacI family DNA-binding transcriptional regulator [Pseudactinotalea sp. HY158]
MVASVTLTEVARAAGVSLSTASLAFSGAGPIAAATRERVLGAAADLGYTGPNPMAASLRRGRSGVVGIVIDNDLRYSFRDPVSLQTLDGITESLGEAGYGVLLIPREDPAGRPHPLLQNAAIDAAILFYALAPRDRAVRTLRGRGVAMIALNGRPRGATSITVEDERGMRLIAEHLRARGHTRVALATLPYSPGLRRGEVDPADDPVYQVTAHRLAGLRSGGIEPVAIWECRGSLVDEGITAGHALLAHHPTALVGQSDLIAAGMLLAVRERELAVPDDVAVAGFDGVDLPWIGEDRLTTIDQPRRDRGKVIAEAAIELAHGRPARGRVLGVELRPGSTS